MKSLTVVNGAGSSSPEVRRSIDLQRHERHGGQIGYESTRLRVITPLQQWGKALAFRLDRDVLLTDSGLTARVRADAVIERGRIAFGVVREDGSTYLAEQSFSTGQAPLEVVVPAHELSTSCQVVFRNAAPAETSAFVLERLHVVYSPQHRELHAVTLQPFTARAKRLKTLKVASINTTEVCNLECVMCHFNGPNAVKKSRTLRPDQVEKILTATPRGDEVWFCATGEFFLEEHAVSYLRRATELGLKPSVLTNGQLFTTSLIDDVLTAGVRFIRMSVDSTDPDQYRKIRRGGELCNIIDACRYLRLQKVERYPDLRVEINTTLFKKTFDKQKEMEDFWRPLVDGVNFNAEYFDVFRFRNVFHVPERRNDCEIRLYVMPSGKIAPCCALGVYEHDHDVSWLPHIDTTASLSDAYQELCEMYEDPNSQLSKLCASCDWWILFGNHNEAGATPYARFVNFELAPRGSSPPHLEGRAAVPTE